jgi:hypothetical protein
MSLVKDITYVINSHSQENGSNTPDFILAEFLVDVLNAWNVAVKKRAMWYERYDSPGQSQANPQGEQK